MKRTVLLKSNLFLYLAVILISALFLSSPSVFASDVVINEFLVDPDSDQWVELYNKSSSAVDVGGWFIDDSGGTEKFIIPNSSTIQPGEFKVFESGFFNLNRTSEDTIKLLNGTSLEDSFSYNAGSGVNRSFGRNIDGTGDWVIFSLPTKGSTNNNSTAVPTPTFAPTPTPTLKPTLTPKPTPTTKPTPTSQPSPTQKASSANTPPEKQSSTVYTQVSNEDKTTSFSSNSSDAAMPTSILGESTISGKENLTSEDATKKEESPALSESNLPKIFIGFGIIFLGACGILGFRSLKKMTNDGNEG